jgi:hypothetical protein
MKTQNRIGSIRQHSMARRGAAILAFVTALLVIGSLSLWVLTLSASTNDAALGHYYTTGAFYAAESGIEMAFRELNVSPATDIDSDGTIGTISNNSNNADDPALATGKFVVSRPTTSPVTYRAVGRPVTTTTPWSNYQRLVEVQAQ